MRKKTKLGKKENTNKGITLIALVITIIVLLILVGISISALTGSGLLEKAKQAKKETIKAQYEEELNLVIYDMRTDSILENEEFNMEYVINKLPKYLEREGIVNYIWDKEQILEEPEGEYKDYMFYIDKNYVAHIDEKIDGIKPEIKAQVKSGYVLEGNSVEIEVIASISEGTVKIIAPNDMKATSIITETEQEKKYIYTVNKNDNYTFIAEGDSGRRKVTTVNVNNIIDRPKISISNNTGTSITVNIINDYPKELNISYVYYLGTIEKATSTEKSYTIEGLTEGTEYTVKVTIPYENTILESDLLTITTISRVPIIKVSGDFELTPLQYPLLTTRGVMNANTTLKNDDQLTIEIPNSKEYKQENNYITYYSLDNGENWEEYSDIFNVTYMGDTVIKAKRVTSTGEVFESEVVYYKGYTYDSRISCTGPTTGTYRVLGQEAYDRDYNSYSNSDTNNNFYFCIQVDSECWNKYVTFYTSCTGGHYYESGVEKHYGALAFSNAQHTRIKAGATIEKQIGKNIMNVLSAKSIKIPENTSYIELYDGTAMSTSFYIYEVWCSEDDLTGTIY